MVATALLTVTLLLISSSDTAANSETCPVETRSQLRLEWQGPVPSVIGVGRDEGGFLLLNTRAAALELHSPDGEVETSFRVEVPRAPGLVEVGEDVWIMDRQAGIATRYSLARRRSVRTVRQPGPWHRRADGPPEAWPIGVLANGEMVVWVPRNPGSTIGGVIVRGRPGTSQVDTIVSIWPGPDELDRVAALPRPLADHDLFAVSSRTATAVAVDRRAVKGRQAFRVHFIDIAIGRDTVDTVEVPFTSVLVPTNVLDTLDSMNQRLREQAGLPTRKPSADEAVFPAVWQLSLPPGGRTWLRRTAALNGATWQWIEADRRRTGCVVLPAEQRLWSSRSEWIWTIRSETPSRHQLFRYRLVPPGGGE